MVPPPFRRRVPPLSGGGPHPRPGGGSHPSPEEGPTPAPEEGPTSSPEEGQEEVSPPPRLGPEWCEVCIGVKYVSSHMSLKWRQMNVTSNSLFAICILHVKNKKVQYSNGHRIAKNDRTDLVKIGKWSKFHDLQPQKTAVVSIST